MTLRSRIVQPAAIALIAPDLPEHRRGGPPAVGVIHVQKSRIRETSKFVGRIQAIDRGLLVARVTACLEQRPFIEGAEVNKVDLLYKPEQPPIQADLVTKQATLQQTQAQLA